MPTSTVAAIKGKVMEHKTQLIIAGVVLLLLIIAFIYVYRKGKSTTSIAPVVKDNPNSNDPENNPAAASDTEIKRIANALHADMDGLTVGHDSQPYQDLLMLSDTDFERVYNEFNTQYQESSGQTLLGWIDNEVINFWDISFDALRTSIDSRMAKLNLK